ncbi:hypothetical protein, partial [Iodidimonas gelatinilytica]|uniref:hypothetical protein n=1 Tax=Iodidimonas gelatinilytica TaxID=1236966 RepID=UPI001B2FFF4F
DGFVSSLGPLSWRAAFLLYVMINAVLVVMGQGMALRCMQKKTTIYGIRRAGGWLLTHSLLSVVMGCVRDTACANM